MRWLILTLGLAVWGIVPAIDYERYKAHRERNEKTQDIELEQALSALREGDIKKARQHLVKARNLGYASSELRKVEEEIQSVEQRRELERLAAQKRREEEKAARKQATARTDRDHIGSTTGPNGTGSLAVGVRVNEVWSITPDRFTVRLRRVTDGFTLDDDSSDWGSGFASFYHLRAGEYVLDITAYEDTGGGRNYSSQVRLTHSGSGSVICTVNLDSKYMSCN